MATGDHTVSLVGSYATLALAISAWDGVSTTAITDYCELHIDPVVGKLRYHLIKIEIAA